VGIFSNIMDKIFRHKPAAPKPAPTAQAPAAPRPAPAPAAAPASAPAVAKPEPVDVEAVLTDLASKNSQTLNWRTSIVDLMKLLDLDSSLASRKELAQELGYKGDTSDSASMNIWLHKQVMAKLAENGGKVPESLK
jgi:3-oxoacyl-ACP reductase-like protein